MSLASSVKKKCYYYVVITPAFLDKSIAKRLCSIPEPWEIDMKFEFILYLKV